MKIYTTSPSHLWLTGHESEDGDRVMAYLRSYPIEVEPRPHHDFPTVWIEKAEIVEWMIGLERAREAMARAAVAEFV